MRFFTADVFTERMFGGNQLAVFPEAEGLDTRVMQSIAREFNLSETVFAFPPADRAHTRRLRIFTPGAELPFAGHPTVGAAFVLASIGAVPLGAAGASIVFEEGVGPVPVSVRVQDGRPGYCELTVAQLPEEGPAPPPIEEIASALSLRTEDLRTDEFAPRGLSCGVTYLFVPVRDVATLGRARLNLPAWERSFSSWWSSCLFPFAPADGRDGVDVRARMFAPAFGVPEDPATGSAAAALAGFLARSAPPGNGTLRWVVEQGVEMGRPSRLVVSIVEGDARVRVSGTAVPIDATP